MFALYGEERLSNRAASHHLSLVNGINNPLAYIYYKTIISFINIIYYILYIIYYILYIIYYILYIIYYILYIIYYILYII